MSLSLPIKGYEGVRNMKLLPIIRPDGPRKNYWLVRRLRFIGGEPFGIVWTVSNHPGLSKTIVEAISELIDSRDWWFEEITKAQFETYREFEFIEFTLQCE